MDQSRTAPAYRPISVQDVTEYDPMRGSVRAKRVNYRLADGTESYVTIPLDRYSAETVQAELEQAAARHAEVMSVQGQPIPTQHHHEPHRWQRGS